MRVGFSIDALEITAEGEPETLVQEMIRAGSSSVAVPERVAVAGRVIDWLLPALTVGGRLTLVTVMETVSESVPPLLSETVKVSGKAPDWVKLGVQEKVLVAGVNTAPRGRVAAV